MSKKKEDISIEIVNPNLMKHHSDNLIRVDHCTTPDLEIEAKSVVRWATTILNGATRLGVKGMFIPMFVQW